MKIYLPDIKNQDSLPVEMPLDTLHRIIRDSPNQRRDRLAMARHVFLDQAAQQKAHDMATKGYIAHTSPSGVSANQNVRNTGYRLPDWYPNNGNNVESLYYGPNNPKDIAAAWLASDRHRAHVYGENDFFRGQTCIGVGYAPAPGEEDIGYCVYITAPCP